MSNTITNTTIENDGIMFKFVYSVASDGTNLTNTVIFDPASIAAISPSGGQSKLPRIMRIRGVIDTASTARAVLRWDATTPILAFSLPLVYPFDFDFRDIGGLTNTGGAGVTGKLTMTTTGLASGDSWVFIVEMQA